MTAGFQQDKTQPAATKERRVVRNESSPSRILGTFATVHNESVKPIVSQNFGESLNNRTHAVNNTKINRYSEDSKTHGCFYFYIKKNNKSILKIFSHIKLCRAFFADYFGKRNFLIFIE